MIKTLFKEEAQLDVHPIFPGVELKCLRKIHKKKIQGGSVWGVRVDVIEELKFL